MNRNRVFYLFILLFLQISTICSFRFNRQSEEPTFEFSSPLYNLSVEENFVGTRYARADNATKIGVPLPEKDATCKFRVAEVVGEKSSLFKAHARQVGDFVFLRIRYKGDNPLNRELKETYELVVKATCRRQDSSNLETTTRVILRVVDRNDASPVFLVDEQGYEAIIDDTTEPFSKVLQVEASDADIGINSAIYFSMVNRSHDFFVDPITGWIRTLRPLKAGNYELKVRAEDRASRLFYFDENEVQPWWTADVLIKVTETKRKQTKVLVETRKIDENVVDRKQLVAVLTLQDAPPDVRVGLEHDDMSHWFGVVPTDDEKFMLWTTPGRSIPRGTNVTVSVGNDFVSAATRRRDALNTTATILVEHQVEHSISFAAKKLELQVDELAPEGSIVGRVVVEVANEEDADVVRFTLQGHEPSNSTFPFSLDSKTGTIRVTSKLDFENERNFDFNVLAQLVGHEKSATIAVSIGVTDGNDHAPGWAVKWLRQAPIPIMDGTKIDTVLLKVEAQDRDEGDNGRIGYKMTSEQTAPLKVDVDSGEISLAAALPKNENVWSVSIWAIDWGSPLSRATALNLVFYRNGTKVPPKPKPIVIQEAENKQAPVFESFPDIVQVSEDAPIGTVIAKLRAVDEDVGYNGLVRYVLRNEGSEALSMDEATGEVKVNEKLTKLMKDGKESVDVIVKVSAHDAGNPPKKTEKTLRLRIVDVNDHAPLFDQPWYRVRVGEDIPEGKELIKVTATDRDGGANGKVRYAVATLRRESGILDGPHITVDRESGIVRLTKMLDRETSDVMIYTIMATDGGHPAKTSFVNLTIVVDDVNDNPPICVRRINKVRIPEDYPDGAFVTCIAARDADIGPNSRLRYSIESNEPGAQKAPLRIDHHTGCVFVHAPKEPMDFHKKSFFNVTIDVADNGEQVLSTSCELHVELIDVAHNHLPIEFDDVAKEASVYENSVIGTEVIMVEAKEVADEKRKYENLRYSIVGGDGRPYFAIDDKGTVRTSAVLDRERKPAYWLTIEARDAAIDGNVIRRGSGLASRRAAVLHVFVRILDRNDHRPQARQPVYFASVKENSPANVVIVKVEATDADDVGNDAAPPLQFRIDRGDPQSFFRIDATSGYMTTSGSRRLDREKQAEHELWVSICDGGEPQLCSQVAVIVSVEDENDNAPAFTQPIHHYNVRASHVGLLCRIFAVDQDEGLNAQLFYNVTEGDSRFSIDENGVISANSPIHGDESYALTVQATDRGTPPQYAATRVVLTAVGGKKKDPKTKNTVPVIAGKKSDYVIPISDADQVGLTIGKLEASDEDGDVLWWQISSGDDSNTFDVRRDSGQLLLAKKVEMLPRGEMRLNVTVTDGEASDDTTVIIQVARSPTKRPTFSASHYQTEISEKTAIGTQVYTLKANGEDIGPGTKPLIYSIFSIEDIAMEDKIRVEPSTGNVIVMEPFDYETGREVRATVRVRQASLTNYATLVVIVSDENDNAPKFTTDNVVAYVDESDPVGSVVAQVTAFDADVGINGIVTYAIVSGNEAGLYELDKSTGEIRLAKKIDRDDHVESILRIRASDGTSVPMSDMTNVYIRNSNTTLNLRVKFTKKQFQVPVLDSTVPGTPLTVLTTQHHGLVTYSTHGPCPYFYVHSLSGAVHLSKWLTRERSAKSVNCTVVATTNDGERDEAKVIIKIMRTNQHAPVFKKQVYHAFIRENSPIGSPILLSDNSPLVVSATDVDKGPSGLVGYRTLAADDSHFAVDLVSGAIRVRRPIDFEKSKEWSFHVQAFDVGQPPRSSPVPALVTVTVVDENDEPPTFGEVLFRANPLFLPTANGITVARQEAVDKDTVGRLRYYIKNTDSKKAFTVNSTTGEVTVADAKGLVEQEYKVEVFVSDGIRSASYNLVVDARAASTSTDGLRFTDKEYTASMAENTTYAVGKTLVSVTAIGGRQGVPVSYSILNTHDAFTIHRGTGVVAFTGIPVDREVESTIRLVVQAKTFDAGKEQTAQTTVMIHIDDINDETPTFVNVPYDVAVSVDAAVGEHLITVRAQDKDNGANGRVQYSSSNLPPSFTIMKSTGKISLAQKLTKLEDFEFDVIAEDGGKPSLKSSEKVRVRAVDKSQPVFSQKVYTATVLTDTVKRGDVVVRISAKSNANGSSEVIGYRLLDDPSKLFSVNWKTGEVRLTKSVRMRDDELKLKVQAVDATRPQLITSAEVVVTLKSPKRKAPVFDKPKYSVRVAESTSVGEKMIDVSATCQDDEKDGEVSYALRGESSNLFSIDSTTGEVRLAKPIDFETKQRYDLIIVASSRRQVQSEAELTIEVDDVNDEVPRFVSPFSIAHVDDSATPPQFITILSVTDLDTVSSLPDAQKLLYSIVDGDETLFDVDTRSGEVKLARLIEDEDIAEETVKKLNISVSDGIFTAYAQLSVEIKLGGRRQLPPRFEQTQYVASALENTAANKSALLTVLARGGISPIRYSLGPASSGISTSTNVGRASWPVRIDKTTGRVHASRVLNYHTDRTYHIPLVAEDSVGRRAFATLTLSVVDVNDKPPVFVLSSYASSIGESAKEGDTVLMVSAVDEDEHDTIEYSLIDDGETSLFHVHPRQGTLTVAKKLEHKAGQTFTLTVKATDSANPPHHATTTIDVSVAPDGTPVPRFSNQHYLFSVPEDAVIGNVIGRVQQVDTEVGEVRYAIAEAAADLPFTVERSTGKVVVRAALDRERKAQWRMAVRADAAGGVHAMTTVTVDVSDVNDNAPAFQGDYQRLTISEDAPVGTSVAIFSATDRDEAPSGRIRFSLLQKLAQFVMDEDSGWLTVGAKLDRERKDRYDLTARVTDEGGLNTDLKFAIVVLDVNDSPPKFDRRNYSVDVDAYSTRDNVSLVDVAILDADLPPHNSSRLFIKGGNEEGIFVIEQDETGAKSSIRLRRVDLLRRQTPAIYNLSLVAFDGLFESTANLTIKVKSTEELICPPAAVRVSVTENNKKGTVVVNETVSPADVVWALETKTGEEVPFVLNMRNGIVKTKEILDYEKMDQYLFTRVISSKTGTRKVLCRQNVTVDVEDQNDNAPVFVQSKYDVSIKENLPASLDERQMLIRVEASDADSDERGQITYSLADDFGVFAIDAPSGVVTVTKPLDRESRGEYVIQVTATDGDKINPKTANATISVSVADQNDNPPVFEKKVYILQVMESESIGYQLAHVRATGGDEGETVTYRLKTSVQNKMVKLDENTGVLTLAEGLDYEKTKKVLVEIEAVDSGTPPLTSSTKVDIVVLDENDNAPVFEKAVYKTSVKENAKNGTKVVQVKALDADSEHFGRVIYSIDASSEREVLTSTTPIPFDVDEDGWVFVKEAIDFEKTKKYGFKIVAKDGGQPPMTSSCSVEVEVKDENDNAPVFDDCNMTAVVQEGVPIGHVVLTALVRDADDEKNSGPFKLEVKGDGGKSFKFDEDMNLRTTTKLHHAKKERFLLTVVAKDVGGLSSDCPLTVWVKEESRHAPVMKPLVVRVNTLHNELRSGIIGRLVASDRDTEDLLRFGIVEDSTRGPLPTEDNPRPVNAGKPHTFRVDASTGDIWAEHSIPAGRHALNVTVTDGKFSTVSYVEVYVSSIDSDVIDHAVAIRIASMTAVEFVASHEATFRRVLALHLNVLPDSIHIISVQEVDSDDGTPAKGRSRRDTRTTDVEILLTAQRGHGRGYLKPDHIYTRLKLDGNSIENQSGGMRYHLTTEVCTTGVCQRGECRERIDMLEDAWTIVSREGVAVVAPHHTRQAQCLCPDGFGGKRCEKEVNDCSRSPCHPWQMCVPVSAEGRGFECVCPLGMDGDKCERPSCDSEGKCLEEAELSVGGQGYFEMSLSNEVETRMELEIEMRTTSTNGVIMYGADNKDYHILSLVEGHIEYSWDAGSGPGMVRSKLRVADGQWHRIAISRRQRRTRLVVDDVDTQEAFSPQGSTVINLHAFSQKLVFGAKVESNDVDNGSKKVSHGVSACFRTISVDGRKVPKTRQGLRLFGASPGCSALTSSPCSDIPCNNGGTCVVSGRSFTCFCPSRYAGDRCEIDTEPCASRPCPAGIQCIPFYNDYLCKCPDGFTGKRCESRGFTELEPSCPDEKCGSGQCISIPRQNLDSADFICNCTGGVLQSTPCVENSTTAVDLIGILLRIEVVVVVAAILLLTIVTCCVYLICRCCKRRTDSKYGAHCDVPHMRNTRVLMPTVDPPPLPPRQFRNDINFVANTNRPTVQVRPFSNANREESRSPSIAGSGKCSQRVETSMSDEKHRNLDALRRYGQRPDDTFDGTASVANRVRHSDRRSERSFAGALANLRDEATFSDDWRASIDENIGAAVRTRMEGAGRLVVGSTELSPVVNDDDYMTMRPRKDSKFEARSSNSLLDSSGSSDDTPPPAVPAHAHASQMETSVLYDEPMSSKEHYATSIDDIDGSDVEEFHINIS